MRWVIRQAAGGIGVIVLASMAVFYFAAQQSPESEDWLRDYLSWPGHLTDPAGPGWLGDLGPRWSWILPPAAVTFAMAGGMYTLTFLLVPVVPGYALAQGRARFSSSRSAIACILALAALPWLTATVTASYSVDLLALRVAMLALTLLPAAVRWMRIEAIKVNDTLDITGRPPLHFGVFVAAAVVVEAATPAGTGAWRVLFAAGGPERLATGVLLLGGAAVVFQAYISAPSVWTLQRYEARGYVRIRRIRYSPVPEGPASVWSRLRHDTRFRTGLIIIVVVVLTALYVRAWSPGGPNDIFNAAEAEPPSSSHWLGLDYLGRDRLTRLASAAGGSTIVALIAVTIATGLGAAMVAAPGMGRPSLRTARRFITTALAVPVVVWLVAPPYSSSGSATSRLALGLAIGLVGMAIAERQLSAARRPWRQAVGPLVGTATTVAAGALAIEFAATMLWMISMNARTPTLGSFVRDLIQEAETARRVGGPPGVQTLTDAPWVWFPPAVLSLILIAALSAMALAALDSRSPQPTQ